MIFTDSRRGIALMVSGGLVLGTLGVFLQEAGQSPLMAVWFRCAFGAAALLVWGALSGRLGELRLDRGGLRAALLAGLLMVLNWALFFGAIQRTSIAVATVVFHVQPFWVMAIGVLWLGEAFSRQRAAAACLALLGLVLATGLFDGSETQVLGSDYVLGLFMCLGGSLSYAGVTIIAKTVRRVTSYALAFWQCLFGTIALAFWPLTDGWPAWGPVWGWLAALGVVHTGFAYVLLYAGMSRLSAAHIAVLQFVYPAFAIVVDWAVYGRALGAVQMTGVVAIGLAQWAAIRPIAVRSRASHHEGALSAEETASAKGSSAWPRNC